MGRTSSSAVVRLGPLARRMLARRRLWLRWAAIGLAALVMLSAVAQMRHRGATRPIGRPAAGHVRDETPARRSYGVADVVPPGMRAVNLIVPAAATFGGRLAPASRVDVLAAFDAGQDRAVRRVLASGIVLHVAPRTASAAAAAGPIPAPSDSRFGAPPLVELALAVPASREREIAMAQAFGRVFIAVEPALPGARPTAAGGAALDGAPVLIGTGEDTLSLHRYLGLPVAAPPVPGALPFSVPLSIPVLRTPPAAGAGSGAARPSPPPYRERGDRVAVEIIEGTTRTVAEVVPW